MNVVVQVDGRRPVTLPARYAEMVRLIVLVMPRMDEMGAGELLFRWNARDRRRTAKDVGMTLAETWQAGVLTHNAAGGMNAETEAA